MTTPLMIGIIAIVVITIFVVLAATTFDKPVEDTFVLTPEFEEILNVLKNTTNSLFISGKAGTGKSTLLKYFTSHTNKKYVVLAPTGIAAMNVKGQTIHSFFRLPAKIINAETIQPDYVRAMLFQQLQVIVIDEISMVSANLMDAIDKSLRVNRNRPLSPFGGVQMVFIGDLFQLPPVVTKDVLAFFQSTYGGVYFFDSPVFKQGFPYYKKELTTIFRQKDEIFKLLLNRIRVNAADFNDFVTLNARHRDNTGENYATVFLTTTNANAKKINKENLNRLASKEYRYEAMLSGTIQEEFEKLRAQLKAQQFTEDELEDKIDNKFPTQVFLKLKEGAQVMLIKNDSLKRWANGTVGIISRLGPNIVEVDIEGKKYSLEREKWEDISYNFNQQTKQIEEVEKGSFTQYPIKLAWAMTIHKSQGKTFDKCVIDIGNGAFSHGQTYVALSRCKTLAGIVLNQPIRPTDIIVDQRIVSYYQHFNV